MGWGHDGSGPGKGERGGAWLRLGRGSDRFRATRRAGNRPDKLTLGGKLQRGLKGDSVRGHEGPEVLEQLKGGIGAMSSAREREEYGKLQGVAGTPYD